MSITELSPFVGQTFNCWKECHVFISKYKEATNQPFIKLPGNTTKYRNNEIKADGVKYPESEDVKFVDYTYLCKHYPRRENNRKYPTSGFLNKCPAKIRAAYDRFKRVIEIKTLDLGHSHPLGTFWNYYKTLDNRKLTLKEQEELASIDMSNKDLAEYATNHLNIKLSRKQVYDMRARVVKRRNDQLKNPDTEKDKEQSSEKNENTADFTHKPNLLTKKTQAPKITAASYTDNGGKEDIVVGESGFIEIEEKNFGQGTKLASFPESEKVINCIIDRSFTSKDKLINLSHIENKKNNVTVSEVNDDLTNRLDNISLDSLNLKRKCIEILDSDDSETNPCRNKKVKVADNLLSMNHHNGECIVTDNEVLNRKHELSKTKIITETDQDYGMNSQNDPSLFKKNIINFELNRNNRIKTGNDYRIAQKTLSNTEDLTKIGVEKNYIVNRNCLGIDDVEIVEKNKIDMIVVDDSDMDEFEASEEKEIRIQNDKKRKNIDANTTNDQVHNTEVGEKKKFEAMKENTNETVKIRNKKRKKEVNGNENNESIEVENHNKFEPMKENTNETVKIRHKKRKKEKNLELEQNNDLVANFEQKLTGEKLVNSENVIENNNSNIHEKNVILIDIDSDSDEYYLASKENTEQESKVKKKKKRKVKKAGEENDDIENVLSLYKENTESKRKKKRDVNVEENELNKGCFSKLINENRTLVHKSKREVIVIDDEEIVGKNRDAATNCEETDTSIMNGNLSCKRLPLSLSSIMTDNLEANTNEEAVMNDKIVNKTKTKRMKKSKKDKSLVATHDENGMEGNLVRSCEETEIKVKKKKKKKGGLLSHEKDTKSIETLDIINGENLGDSDTNKDAKIKRKKKKKSRISIENSDDTDNIMNKGLLNEDNVEISSKKNKKKEKKDRVTVDEKIGKYDDIENVVLSINDNKEVKRKKKRAREERAGLEVDCDLSIKEVKRKKKRAINTIINLVKQYKLEKVVVCNEIVRKKKKENTNVIVKTVKGKEEDLKENNICTETEAGEKVRRKKERKQKHFDYEILQQNNDNIVVDKENDIVETVCEEVSKVDKKKKKKKKGIVANYVNTDEDRTKIYDNDSDKDMKRKSDKNTDHIIFTSDTTQYYIIDDNSTAILKIM